MRIRPLISIMTSTEASSLTRKGEEGEEEREGEEEKKWRDCVFFLVGNIPSKFRSADLRAVFSQFVEKEYFVCFHYRHRPEQIQTSPPEPTSSSTESHNEIMTDVGTGGPSRHGHGAAGGVAKTKCCVVAMERSGNGGREFVQMYANKNWSTADGGFLRQKARITELKTDFRTIQQTSSPAPHHADVSGSGGVPWDELKALPELNPPNVMPRGNVGTPLATFMQLIRSCKLPSQLIRKLQLEFPKSRTKKRYGAVALDYGTRVEPGDEVSEEEDESIANRGIGRRIRGKGERAGARSGDPGDNEAESDKEDDIPPDDDHDAEEWERYEAFHDDADKQGRTKERLYEEELEVVWDKGSSGLVFYTDASYWDQQEGDFDEKCSKEDDWDVDMSAYYDYDGGDKDARDMRDMAMERRLRDGEDTGTWTGVAGFEKHTKGFGSRVLKKSGWREGSGVGASNQGISEPLEAEGQHPRSKKGLGYRGEKLNRNIPPAKRRKATKDVLISTIYDRPSEQEDTVLRTAPSTTLKYRTTTAAALNQVQFLKGEVLQTPSDSDKSTST